MTRPQRIYRLVIEYPDGSKEPGWRPPAYDHPRFLATLTRAQRREHLATPFRWPRERQFLSHSGAWKRASLLTWYGALVDVQASDPITWPNHDDPASQDEDAWTWGTAASWSPELDEFDLGDVPLPTAESERREREEENR